MYPIFCLLENIIGHLDPAWKSEAGRSLQFTPERGLRDIKNSKKGVEKGSVVVYNGDKW